MPHLVLTSISAVSPSLAEVLRLCALRAGFSKAEGAASLVLGNPKAWLGIAYHEVLADAIGLGEAGSESAHEAAWASAIRRQHDRAQLHPLDRRFYVPERWPGYYLVRSMALMRAREIAGASRNAKPSGDFQRRGSGREQWLSSADGRIVGRPDLVRDDAVIDFKTSEVHEHDDSGESKIAKAAYIRQLQLYAFLVKECTGRWPVRGVLLPMGGAPFELEMVPSDCERVAEEALESLDRYNRQIEEGVSAGALANPSSEACKWCPYHIFCPSFWEAANDSWIENLGTASVGGLALAAPRPIYRGASLALDLSCDEGTGPRGIIGVAPLSPGMHPALQQVQTGTRTRVVGLARRADGTVVPTVRTVLARLEDLPDIVVCGNSAGPVGGAHSGETSHLFQREAAT